MINGPAVVLQDRFFVGEKFLKKLKKSSKKFADSKNRTTFASPFGKSGQQEFFNTNFLKKLHEKFADSKIVRIFAVPLVKNGRRLSAERLFFLAPIFKRFFEKTVKQESTSKYREQRER